MKHLIFVISAIICSLDFAMAQSNRTTSVEFTEYSWDFGTIDEVDGAVQHSFKFRNTGSKPFVVTAINISCGCTTPQYSKAPTLPGQSDEIKITFDPMNRPGRFEKQIIVQSNNNKGAITLIIRGLVKPRPRTLEDDYPVALSSGIRLEDISIDMGNISGSGLTVVQIGVVNNSAKAATLNFEGALMPPWLKINNKTEIAAGEKCKIDFTISPVQTAIWGHKHLEVPILINGVIQPFKLNLLMTFIEDFSSLTPQEIQDAPRGDISSYFYHFSTVHRGDKLIHTFRLTNVGQRPLIIRYLDFQQTNVLAATSSMTIPSGESAEITVQLLSQKTEAVAEMVRVITNDPYRPVIELRLMANIL
ncbi:MAG: DUF1573 domain-containing protein [Mucinivorans sp.]